MLLPVKLAANNELLFFGVGTRKLIGKVVRAGPGRGARKDEQAPGGRGTTVTKHSLTHRLGSVRSARPTVTATELARTTSIENPADDLFILVVVFSFNPTEISC